MVSAGSAAALYGSEPLARLFSNMDQSGLSGILTRSLAFRIAPAQPGKLVVVVSSTMLPYAFDDVQVQVSLHTSTH